MPPTIEPVVRGLADERGVKATALMQAMRLAVSGSSASPGLFEMLALLGRDTVVARLRRAATSLSVPDSRSAPPHPDPLPAGGEREIAGSIAGMTKEEGPRAADSL